MEDSHYENEPEYNAIWTNASTLFLINLYKQYRKTVGTLKVKNFKMWEIISQELANTYKMAMTASNCENRWWVLERNYKKFLDNNNQKGAGRRQFEFCEQIDILGSKNNVKPTVLLSTITISSLSGPVKGVTVNHPTEIVEVVETSAVSHSKENVPIQRESWILLIQTE